jgi:hypothetical protein
MEQQSAQNVYFSYVVYRKNLAVVKLNKALKQLALAKKRYGGVLKELHLEKCLSNSGLSAKNTSVCENFRVTS